MNEISGRRVAGFVALAVAIVLGVLLLAYAASPPRPDPDATPIPTPAETLAVPGDSDASVEPGASDEPAMSIEIPPPIQ